MSGALAGVLPVFQTPFLDDESIDFDTLGREISWLLDRGAQGVVMAMVSETLRLSGRERMELAAEVCRLVQGRGVSIISVGAESHRVAAEFLRHAEQCGATAVMAIPPVSVALGEDELFDYYQRLIRGCRLPVIVQDASGYVGRPLSIALQAQLLAEYPERVLFKPEANPIGPRVTALREATGGRAGIFEGSGGVALVDSFQRGIVGTMPGAEIIDAQVALWRALVAGNQTVVDRLYPLVCSLVSLQTSLDGFLAVEKYLLVRQGIFHSARVRGPVGYRLDGPTQVLVDRWFDRLQAELAGLHRTN